MGKPNRIFDAKGDLVPVQVEIENISEIDEEKLTKIFVNTGEL